MSFKSMDTGSLSEVPNFDHLISTAAGKKSINWGETDVPNDSFMTLKSV